MSPDPGAPLPAPMRRRWFADWRVWLGIAITVVCIWYAMRGVPIAEVRDAMARADLWILSVLSVPAYVAAVYFRALRWRHLTNPVASISRGALFRASAIGFMVNNIAPLRIGELVRSWYLARESQTSTSAILGTVVLERVVDIVCVLLLAAGSLALAGLGSQESGLLGQGAVLLLPAALAPLACLIFVRVAPDRTIAVAHWLAAPLPARFSERIEQIVRQFAEGLGALRGGSHLFWIVFHSALIWLVFSTVPILAGLLAFGIELDSPARTIVTCWVALAAIGVAVAIPSAPGFFGPYQLAFKAVLERFGVDPATALALGLLVWFVFWATLTLQGLLVLRARDTSLGELAAVPDSKDPTTERR